MIGYKIKLNNRSVYTVGQKDTSILNADLVVSRGNSERDADDYIRLNVGGLSQVTEKGFCEHFRWKQCNLEVGDVLEVEIVETESVDPPLKRYRSDNEVQENPFTDDEIREMRYQDYLLLKKEFETDGVA